MLRFVFVPALIAISGLLCAGGCSCSSGPRRLAVYGKIDSKREVQAITLRPAASVSAPAVTTAVTNGSYAFTKENGPVPGEYVAVFIFTEQAASSFPGGKRKEMAGPAPPPVSPQTSPPGPDPEVPVSVPASGSLEINIPIP